MNISDIESFRIWLGARNICLVKVTMDNGTCGWGESGLSGRELAVTGAISHFREFLIGQSALNIGALWQEMYRSQYFEGGRVLAAAISAIDIALHDALGKRLQVPVHQLLGGKQRDYVPLFATAIAPHNDHLLEEVAHLKQQNWSVIRLTTGEHGKLEQPTVYEPRTALANTARSLIQVRELVGDEMVLGIDFHHRLSVAETASFLNKLPDGTLDFIEEPIRAESPSSYQTLRNMTNVPFAIGEELTSKWSFMPFIEAGVMDFSRIDICNAGGFTEAMKIAALCETKYIDMMPHNPLSPLCTQASVHFCAAIANCAWLEWLPYSSDDTDYDAVFSQRPVPINNALPVSNTPGLGIEINEDEVRKRSFAFWEPPRLKRRDGSYQNW